MSKIKAILFIEFIFFLLISCKDSSKNIAKPLLSYYPTGELKSAIVFDSKTNKKCGQFYYLNGNLEKEICNLNGKKVDTMKTYYSNGALKSKMYYEFGKVEGQTFWYHSNGKLKETVAFNNDKADGLLESYLPSGNLDFINYFENGFLHYVKYYRRDSTGKVRSVSENYIPKVTLNKDTISYGDTLIVNFDLSVPKDSINCANLFVKFDFFKGKELYDKLHYPANELLIENEKAHQSFIIEDRGDQVLHGSIFTNEGGVEKYYKRFEKHFYVKEHDR